MESLAEGDAVKFANLVSDVTPKSGTFKFVRFDAAELDGAVVFTVDLTDDTTIVGRFERQ
jgi:hypothetical protein